MNNEECCKDVMTSGTLFKIEIMPNQDPKEFVKELGKEFDLLIMSPAKCGATDEPKECGALEIMAVKKAKGGALGLDAESEGIARILRSIHPDDAPIRGRLQEMSEGVEIHERKCRVDE